MDNTDSHGSYEVGYGKPPKATRFTSGQSGNPNGRPPGSESTRAIVRRVLDKKLRTNENGKPVERSLRELKVLTLAEKAIKTGDPYANEYLDKFDYEDAKPERQIQEFRLRFED
jgi:hypothetical protein